MAKPLSRERELETLERGYQYYTKKDYKGAVKAFSEVVENSTDHVLLNALDCRAASYEKLQDLQGALRDSKTMIKMMPNSSKESLKPRGYLRTGKVLCLKGENSLALKIYERGLSKIKIDSDEERVILQSLHNKLKFKQTPQKSYDPLNYLPLELVQMICQKLEMRDLVICLRVRKSWKLLLESLNCLWTRLDISHSLRSVSNKSLRAYLKRSNYSLTCAMVNLKVFFDEKKMSYLTQTCKTLRELEIYGQGMIGEKLEILLQLIKKIEKLYISQSTLITLSVTQAALRACQNTLVEASILNIRPNNLAIVTGSWPKLDALKIITLNSSIGTAIDLKSFISATPNLTTFISNGCLMIPHGSLDLTAWSYLERLDLSSSQLTRLPQLPPKIKHLILDYNPLMFLTFHEEEGPFLLPLLETFSCQATFIEARGLLEITDSSIKAKNLKSLSIGDRQISSTLQLAVSEEYPACPTLEELSLAFLNLKDERVLEILDLYPQLKRIDLSGTLVTGVTVKALVAKGVHWIRVNDCYHISHDAIEMARGKGFCIIFNFSNEARPRRSLFESFMARP